MKSAGKILACALLALSLMQLTGCKTIAKALGIPYGQVNKVEKALK